MNVDRIVERLQEAGKVAEGGPGPSRRVRVSGRDVNTVVFTARIEPKKRYLLAFRIFNHGYQIDLHTSGKNLFRVCRGQPTPFVYSKSDEIHATPIWTSGNEPIDVSVSLIGSCLEAECSAEFVQEGFGQYDEQGLPIKLSSMMPYAVEVSADRNVSVETYKMYLPGYEATVNGRAAKVLKSPEGNAMVAIPAGRSVVELQYRGTKPMRVSWWISLLGWACTVGWLLDRTRLRRFVSPPVNGRLTDTRG